MKFFLVLLLLSGLAYGGYIFYQQTQTGRLDTASLPQNQLIFSESNNKLSDLAKVLGESIGNTFENGKELLSDATSGKSEPIINELVTKTTDTLKDLPRKEAEKIKYEFCRGVITEYESTFASPIPSAKP